MATSSRPPPPARAPSVPTPASDVAGAPTPGINAAKPRPSALRLTVLMSARSPRTVRHRRRRFAPLPRQELARQFEVALGALGRDVVEDDRFAERRRLRKSNIPRHGRLIDAGVEMAAHLVGHLFGQVLSVV